MSGIIVKVKLSPFRATKRLHFQKPLHRGIGEGATPFPGLLHFTLDPYLILLNVKKGGIKYHFLVFGMTRTGFEPQTSGP